MADLGQLYTSLHQVRQGEERRRQEIDHLINEMKRGLAEGETTGDPLKDYVIRNFKADQRAEKCLREVQDRLQGRREQLCLSAEITLRLDSASGVHTESYAALRLAVLTGEALSFDSQKLLLPAEAYVRVCPTDGYCISYQEPLSLDGYAVALFVGNQTQGRVGAVGSECRELREIVAGDKEVSDWFRNCHLPQNITKHIRPAKDWLKLFKDLASALGYPENKLQALLA